MKSGAWSRRKEKGVIYSRKKRHLWNHVAKIMADTTQPEIELNWKQRKMSGVNLLSLLVKLQRWLVSHKDASFECKAGHSLLRLQWALFCNKILFNSSEKVEKQYSTVWQYWHLGEGMNRASWSLIINSVRLSPKWVVVIRI